MKLALVSSLFLGSSGASAPRTEDIAFPQRSAARAPAPVGSKQPAPTAGGKAARGRRLGKGCPTEDVISCDNGEAFNGTTSCEDACGGQCCKGTDACKGFTGDVCKDGASCIGEYACRFATIGSVTQGCNGEFACAAADNIDLVMDGCNGTSACNFAAIGSVLGGCIGLFACTGAGFDSVAGVRNIGSIRESCDGHSSCYEAALDSSGGIETIWGSCNAGFACNEVGNGDGAIPEIAECCNTPEECQRLDATQLLDRNCTAPSAPPSISSKPSASAPPSSSGKPSLIPSATPSVSSQPSGVPTPVPGKSSKGRKSGKSSGAKGKGKSSKHGTKGKSESIINLQYIAADASMSTSTSFDFDFDIDANTGIQQVPRERAWG